MKQIFERYRIRLPVANVLFARSSPAPLTAGDLLPPFPPDGRREFHFESPKQNTERYRIRTCHLRLRRATLYPNELISHVKTDKRQKMTDRILLKNAIFCNSIGEGKTQANEKTEKESLGKLSLEERLKSNFYISYLSITSEYACQLTTPSFCNLPITMLADTFCDFAKSDMLANEKTSSEIKFS